MVEFSLLGSVRAVHEGRELELGRRQERCLLGLLLLEAGRVVTTDRIVGLLWNDVPPATARATVHSYVARLRAVLAPYDVRVATRGAGYVAEVDPQTVDVHRFAHAIANAQQETNPQARAEMLGDALALWHGPPLADVADDHLRGRLGARLIEQRLLAFEWWAEAALAVGRHGDVLTRLTEVVESHPTQERLVGLLMQARYRCGDVAGALAAFATARRRLADQLGIEPGEELSDLHLAILNRKTLSRVPDAPRPRQLPPDVATFSGRAAQLRLLDDLLPADTDHLPRTVVISAIAGTPGVGKTTMALHWAHQVAPRFPDGQLYVNLRGFDPTGSQMSVGEAIRGFLDAFNTPVAQLPANLGAQAALYRSLLADRQVLIVLDNARDADHVRPLLPGSPSCLVVVTSRSQLTGLVVAEGARPLTLGLLTVAEAHEMLARHLGPERLAGQLAEAEELIAHCARLPLALAIVAARAAEQPTFPLATFVAEVADARSRLDALDTGDHTTQIRAVFSWSYDQLSPPAAQLFRLLGLHPGPDISLPAAASLLGVQIGQIRLLLTELARAHLVSEHVPGRYAFHDLLRAYAIEQAHAHDSEADRRAAMHRMLDHYLHTADRACHLLPVHGEIITLDPVQPGVTIEDLTDVDHALGWLTAEHPVLIAAVEQAAATGFDLYVWQLAWTMRNYFDRHGHWRDWEATHRIALHAAKRMGNREAEAYAHRGIGRANIRLEHYDDAGTHIRCAIDIAEELGDTQAQAAAELSLAWTLERMGSFQEAVHHAQSALQLYLTTSNAGGQAQALNNVGWYHAMLGNYAETLNYCGQALDLNRALGHRDAEAATLDSIGFAHHHLGDLEQALSCYQLALDLRQGTDDHYRVGDTLTHIGEAHEAAGNPGAAREAWLNALEIFDQLGHSSAADVRAKLASLDRRTAGRS